MDQYHPNQLLVYVYSKLVCSWHIFQFVLHVYSNYNQYLSYLNQIHLRIIYGVPCQYTYIKMGLLRNH